jgi:OmpA family
VRKGGKIVKKFAPIGVLGSLLVTVYLYAQGLNPGNQTKDDWEEINFEFNSAILSDGYPSLLRLADLLSQHRDYKVRITGNTDIVGSNNYNERLGLARANAVRDFLIKYGAGANQITTATEGKTTPEVNNATKEGRFINRRVTLMVTDAQGNVIKEGSIGQVINAIPQAAAPSECCNDILRQLNKLDDILAALKNLEGENEKLRGELAELRNEENTLRDQVNGLPKTIPPPPPVPSAKEVADEIQQRDKKFSIVGINIGPTYGPDRFGGGEFTASGRAQFFSPFGADGTRAVQAEGEYMYYPGRQEGQFDIGLVERWGNFQAGAFGSFKGFTFRDYQSPGFLGEGAFLADYLFSRGRIGAFVTAGFKDDSVLNSTTLAPGLFLQTYAHVANQYGINTLFGVWGNAFIQANAGYVRMRDQADMPGAMIKLVQPLSQKVSFTTEVGLNETYVSTSDKGRIVFGLEFGNYIRPKEYTTVTTPVPMDVPRIRYQLLTRRVGDTPPVANAGPNQIGVPPGLITLNGSGSYDADGEPLTYSWQQIYGPSVAISGANAAIATFTAAADTTYSFRLTVTNPGGLFSTATTTVKTTSPTAPQITSFTASPATITAGGTSTLSWTVTGASSVSISPNIGTVNAQSGSTTVSPTQTTTYTLTATSSSGSVHASVVVTVTSSTVGPQIVRFQASPLTITAGQSSTLSWASNGGAKASISSVGTVPLNGSVTVSPTTTTTYTLTVTAANGQSVTAPVTVTVSSSSTTGVQILSFYAVPFDSIPGAPVTLNWTTTNAAKVVLTGSGILPQTLPVNGSVVVNPIADATYTLTAYSSSGQSVSTVLSVSVR